MVISKKSSNFALANGGLPLEKFAEIAQLVEHNLAKVGVAGSSPVFRSKDAAVVESVDTQDLKSFGHYGCAGSSPAPGTEKG